MRILCSLFGHRTEELEAEWTKVEGVLFPLWMRLRCSRCGETFWDYNRTAPQIESPDMLDKMTKLLESEAITTEQFRRWFDYWSRPHGVLVTPEQTRKTFEDLYR